MIKKELKSAWPLVGNENIIRFLSKNIQNNTLSGTYIFAGPQDLGKKTLAFFFAQTILCQARKKESQLPCGSCPSCRKFQSPENKGEHSDLYMLEKEEEKKNISIEQIRDFIKKLSMSSFLDSYKIGIINDAHTLNAQSANALLKTLEEPKNNVVIILTTSFIESLPQTIVSRSKVLHLFPVKTDIIHDYLVKEKKISRSAAKNYAHLSIGRPALALKFSEDEKYSQNYLLQAESFLDFFTKDLNDRFLSIEELLGSSKGQEGARTARAVIDVWSSLVRDLLLLEFGQNDLIRNEVIKIKLEAVKGRNTVGSLLRIMKMLGQGHEHIDANVNPKLALEQIAVSI